MYGKYYECYTVQDAEKGVVFLLTGKNKSGLKKYYNKSEMIKKTFGKVSCSGSSLCN
jgi:hypothetical protein